METDAIFFRNKKQLKVCHVIQNREECIRKIQGIMNEHKW